VRSERRSSAAAACVEVRATAGECPRGFTQTGVRRAACSGRPVWLWWVNCKAQRSRLQSLEVIERKQASPQSLKAGVVCKEPRWQSAAVNREEGVSQSKRQSAEGRLVPNPSFERTPYSQLRWLPGAAQLER
jgi:hypothetical protein